VHACHLALKVGGASTNMKKV